MRVRVSARGKEKQIAAAAKLLSALAKLPSGRAKGCVDAGKELRRRVKERAEWV